ncbi:MAG: hypothetical protein LBD06_12375 [Candidatus Accumulibacter sp.]|jgi:hypothetical protein|nr:hypothetical protein [Accumulibacter sp.]
MEHEILTVDVLRCLDDERTIKIVVTSDDDGVPHPAVKESLRAEEGHLVYLDFIESSRSNRHMTKALWFDGKISVLLLTADRRSFRIIARPLRAVTNTKRFEGYYREAKEKYGLDLATAWILQPLEMSEGTLRKRVGEEAQRRAYFNHLDRLALKTDGAPGFREN